MLTDRGSRALHASVALSLPYRSFAVSPAELKMTPQEQRDDQHVFLSRIVSKRADRPPQPCTACIMHSSVFLTEEHCFSTVIICFPVIYKGFLYIFGFPVFALPGKPCYVHNDALHLSTKHCMLPGSSRSCSCVFGFPALSLPGRQFLGKQRLPVSSTRGIANMSSFFALFRSREGNCGYTMMIR